MFTKSVNSVLPHVREPIGTSFFLITSTTCRNKISKISATFTFRLHMVECKLVKFIGFSAINTCTVKMLFDTAPPKTLSFRGCHGY